MPKIKQVYDSLKELDGLLSDLKVMVVQQRADIIALDINGLNERRIGIDNLYAKVRTLSDRTTELISIACEAFGITEEKNFSQLLSVIPKADRDQFTSIQSSVKNGTSRIENSLAINRALLKDSMHFADSSLQMFTDILKTSTNNTYGLQGRYTQSPGQPRLICQEI